MHPSLPSSLRNSLVKFGRKPSAFFSGVVDTNPLFPSFLFVFGDLIQIYFLPLIIHRIEMWLLFQNADVLFEVKMAELLFSCSLFPHFFLPIAFLPFFFVHGMEIPNKRRQQYLFFFFLCSSILFKLRSPPFPRGASGWESSVENGGNLGVRINWYHFPPLMEPLFI